jgi:hypothetical protein
MSEEENRTPDPSLQRVKDILDAKGPLPVIDPEKPETVPVNLTWGGVRRLDFKDKKPGMVYWYCNDDRGGRSISDALDQGWRFTIRSDVRLNAAVTPRNNALGSYVRQHVGIDDSGGPMYAYLMEMSEKLFELLENGPGSRGEYHRKLIEQIHQGTIAEKANEHRTSVGRPYPGTRPDFLPAISADTRILKPTR